MQASVLDEQGKAVTMFMGCYGIGVTRVVAAAIEQNHDANGIIWPEPLAPFNVVLVPINYQKSERVRQRGATGCTRIFGAAGIDVLLDDRDARPGREIRRCGAHRDSAPAGHRRARRSMRASSNTGIGATASRRKFRPRTCVAYLEGKVRG